MKPEAKYGETLTLRREEFVMRPKWIAGGVLITAWAVLLMMTFQPLRGQEMPFGGEKDVAFAEKT
jgi:hypothetical protein